jgi:hypothetical protein
MDWVRRLVKRYQAFDRENMWGLITLLAVINNNCDLTPFIRPRLLADPTSSRHWARFSIQDCI